MVLPVWTPLLTLLFYCFHCPPTHHFQDCTKWAYNSGPTILGCTTGLTFQATSHACKATKPYWLPVLGWLCSHSPSRLPKTCYSQGDSGLILDCFSRGLHGMLQTIYFYIKSLNSPMIVETVPAFKVAQPLLLQKLTTHCTGLLTNKHPNELHIGLHHISSYLQSTSA